VALILRDEGPDEAFLWQLPVEHLYLADPISLKINNFYDRRWPEMKQAENWGENPALDSLVAGGHFAVPDSNFVIPSNGMTEWAVRFVELTRGAHLVANVPSFDSERLIKLLRRWGQTHMWHYHLVCVENLAAGRLGIQPPWKSSEVMEALGVPVPDDRHGALPDALWARDAYDAVFEHWNRQELDR
jgi:hypothetical protein